MLSDTVIVNRATDDAYLSDPEYQESIYVFDIDFKVFHIFDVEGDGISMDVNSAGHVALACMNDDGVELVLYACRNWIVFPFSWRYSLGSLGYGLLVITFIQNDLMVVGLTTFGTTTDCSIKVNMSVLFLS